MDELAINPDEFNPADSTLDMEGVGESVEVIQEAYHEEPFQQPLEEQEQEINQLAVQKQAEALGETKVNQPTQKSATAQLTEKVATDTTGMPAPLGTQDQLVKSRKGAQFGGLRKDENGFILKEDLVDINGHALPDGVIQALKLQRDWDPREAKLKELFKDGWNLEKQLEAFNMIRNDEELAARYDHNDDGEVTYADFFDTTNLNGGAGMTDEEDAIATREWLAGLANPTAASRMKAIWQQNGAGQNMARYINLRRQHALAPQEGIDVGEDWRQASAGGLFDLSTWLVGAVGSVESAINKKIDKVRTPSLTQP